MKNESLKKASEVLSLLLKSGELNEQINKELYYDYVNNEEVREILEGFQEGLDCKIIRIVNSIYLIPNQNNEVLGFNKSDIKRSLWSNSTNVDVYLIYYIMMYVFYKFYSGQSNSPKVRESLLVDDLLSSIDSHFNEILNSAEDAVRKDEEELGLNINKVASKWTNMLIDDPTKQNSKLQKSKYGYVYKALNILVEQRLIRLLNNDLQIWTTSKLDNLMSYYYLNSDRKDEIEEIFERRGEENGENE